MSNQTAFIDSTYVETPGSYHWHHRVLLPGALETVEVWVRPAGMGLSIEADASTNTLAVDATALVAQAPYATGLNRRVAVK